MATNELEEPAPETGLAAAQRWLTGTVTGVSETAADGVPLRIWLLMVIVGVSCLLAPVPANAIGVVASLILAMSLARRA